MSRVLIALSSLIVCFFSACRAEISPKSPLHLSADPSVLGDPTFRSGNFEPDGKKNFPYYTCLGLNDQPPVPTQERSQSIRAGTPRIAYTCTTFLAKPGKFEQLQEALGSIARVHSKEELGLIERFLVINEYSPANTDALAQSIQAQYPWVEFVQKGPQDAGQAKSLNIILDAIRGMDYWVQWEESWTCVRPFIAEAVATMNHSNITQLQFSDDIWRGPAFPKARYTLGQGEGFVCIAPSETFRHLEPILSHETADGLHQHFGLEGTYPMFSLRPSINRVAFADQLGYFDTRPEMWPWRFEWDYGLRWIRAGGIKGILWEDAAHRIENHVSTYRSPN